MLVSGIEVDKRFAWPLGRAEKLARRGVLPHVVLPDGAVRFEWGEVVLLPKRVEPLPREDVTNGK